MGVAYDLLAVVRDFIRPVGVRKVVAGTAEDDIGARRVVERVYHVVAVAAGELVGGGIAVRAVVYQIVTIIAGDGVRAQRAGYFVIARPTGDRVIAAAAVDLVLARTARERVGAVRTDRDRRPITVMRRTGFLTTAPLSL